MICDKCKKEVGTRIQKFHKPYADYLKLNQINGFCKSCWYKIVSLHGTWLDICVKESVKSFLIDRDKDDFKKEYESIWISSKEIIND